MITPAHIRKKAARRYRAFLRAHLRGESFFPLEIRFRKAKADDDYLALREWVQKLVAGSKAEQGYGYVVDLEERTLRRYGRQSLPARIAIETKEDFLRLTGKTAEFHHFRQAANATLTQFPQLRDWLSQYPQRLLKHLDVWQDILTVCAYLVDHPRPNCYIRELPAPVHTKFIEDNQAILGQLLDQLLPADAIRAGEDRFERRYYLRYDEPTIRLRLLDDALRATLGWPVADLSAPLSQIVALPLSGRPVFIVENKMNFLTFPAVDNGLAVWGRGYQASLLGNVPWLAECSLWYWGDLDVQGLQILGQLRRHYPGAQSLMMDEETLAQFRPFLVQGAPDDTDPPPTLTPAEQQLYRRLQATNTRLEQEKIEQSYVKRRLQKFLQLL